MTYYESLGVSRGANPEEIQSAYETGIARINSGEMEEALRTEKLSDLNKAFTILSDKTSREIYDNLLDKRELETVFTNRHGGKGNPAQVEDESENQERAEAKSGFSYDGLERLRDWLSPKFLGPISIDVENGRAIGALLTGLIVRPILMLSILWILLKERRTGWFAAFIIMCGWPFLFLELRINEGLFWFLIVLFALVMISIYCLILKSFVDGKLGERDDMDKMAWNDKDYEKSDSASLN